MRLIAFSMVAAIMIFQPAATVAQVSNSMTCQQAIKYYERNGRIQTNANGNATVPIYGYTPASQRSRMGCSSSGIQVRTSDKRRCTIAYKCLPRGR
ncbi:hypothetical protein K1W69_15695 [Hoeflea sp. WL0058]|uniref:Uncharacterized protein n=1 Tax=Flavimaribacter sediminis TaxID=2865987 RepID=A0AAE2ZMD6_9HYPH|nr:hypothetical protein [Flavimaribacter sediminis]MBW8638639.1 hypothetical protein [Flavimaribacter sediminis]